MSDIKGKVRALLICWASILGIAVLFAASACSTEQSDKAQYSMPEMMAFVEYTIVGREAKVTWDFMDSDTSQGQSPVSGQTIFKPAKPWPLPTRMNIVDFSGTEARYVGGHRWEVCGLINLKSNVPSGFEATSYGVPGNLCMSFFERTSVIRFEQAHINVELAGGAWVILPVASQHPLPISILPASTVTSSGPRTPAWVWLVVPMAVILIAVLAYRLLNTPKI
ncbi:hypothetical protein ACFLWB_02250 [Chloroflexota bacterium]